MADFTSGFWSIYIAVLTIVSIIGCAWLLWSQSTVKINVSADGKYLWLSGRFDDVVYRIDTATGAYQTIQVGMGPHGLTVWPQPGRYSLGHTGNLR